MSTTRTININDYADDIKSATSLPIPWTDFAGKTILVTGASGMIGSCIVDILSYLNTNHSLGCKIYTLSRSKKKLEERFPTFFSYEWFNPIIQDISTPLSLQNAKIDFIINNASNTHPIDYANDPIGTITTNIIGLKNLLDYAVKNPISKIVEVSTIEIYGKCIETEDTFTEEYCGLIDCNTLRAGYPESKRTCETLCHAYHEMYGIPFVIARPCRVYGPTMQPNDSKASAQFIKNVLADQDIVLKSTGDQLFSYAYMLDIATGILTLLLKGKNGEAYNIADSNGNLTLKEFATLVAEVKNKSVIFDLPNDVEKKGFSGAVRAIQSTSKIETLGWKPLIHPKDGIKRTIHILEKLYS